MGYKKEKYLLRHDSERAGGAESVSWDPGMEAAPGQTTGQSLPGKAVRDPRQHLAGGPFRQVLQEHHFLLLHKVLQ